MDGAHGHIKCQGDAKKYGITIRTIIIINLLNAGIYLLFIFRICSHYGTKEQIAVFFKAYRQQNGYYYIPYFLASPWVCAFEPFIPFRLFSL
jgi:hypothetical protein